MTTRRATALPTLAVTASAVMWGLKSGLTGDWISLAVYTFGAVVLLPVALTRWKRLAAGGLDLLVIALCLGVALTAWNHAVLTGEVVRVVLLFYLCPVWATGFARIILKEPVSPVRGLSILLGLGGAAVVLGFEGGVPLPRAEGEWMAVFAGVLFALAATYARKAEGCTGFDKTFATFAAAVPVALLFILVVPVGAAPTPGQFLDALPLLTGATVVWLLPQTWLVLWGAERLDPGRVTRCRGVGSAAPRPGGYHRGPRRRLGAAPPDRLIGIGRRLGLRGNVGLVPVGALRHRRAPLAAARARCARAPGGQRVS
jgi:drug/metabolite transporter (DMT)-like permease